jgi:DNA-binding response OmpR family regulator
MSKIVVVDDSYAELQMIEGYLKAASHTVVSFPNTDKLEDKIVSEKPDLIVMDVVMPGRNGFQKGQERDKFWGQQQGANGYVVKPFKAEDLLAAVKRALN